MKGANVLWTDAEINVVREMYLKGKTDAEIGAVVKRTVPAVTNLRRKLAILRPPGIRYIPKPPTPAPVVQDTEAACIAHLIDLRRAYALNPRDENEEFGVAVRRYRRRCELAIGPGYTHSRSVQVYLPALSYCGSQAAMCSD